MIGKKILHYKISEKLGEGGMGVVYLAEDTKLERQVAIKFLPFHVSGNIEENKRFKTEARAAAAINHPNIATIHAFEETETEMFLVMEYIEGVELKQKISDHPLPVDEALQIAYQIASGINLAHKKNIIHRDIKSSNIMFTSENQVKIMDFGLAKFKGAAQITRIGTTLGTAAYMSPEQAEGEITDLRTDIWSFGVVFFEMLTGELPFKGEYAQALIYSILNKDPGSLRRYQGIPDNVVLLVERCLQKDKNLRFQSMQEIVDILKPDFQHSYISESTPVIKDPAYRIAVLPFANISSTTEDDYIADGLTEELIFTLSKISNLKIIARMSVLKFKNATKTVAEIGTDLRVGLLLQGSLRKADDKIRISVQLIDARSEESIWSQIYDRKFEDILAIQSDIANQVASALKVNLFGEEKKEINRQSTHNVEAYNLYLKGIYLWNKRTESELIKAIECFEQAIELDKDFALAYAGLADAYIIFGDYNYLIPKEAFPKAKSSAKQALELDSNLAHAYNALACVESVYEWDWKEAQKNFNKAIDLDPNYAVAHQWYAINYLVPQKKFKEAISEMEVALNLEPWSLIIITTTGLVYYFSGDYDKATEYFEKTIELDPNFAVVYYFASWAYGKKGEFEKALEYIERARDIMGDSQALQAETGIIHSWAGNIKEALQIYKQIKHSDINVISAYTMYSIAAFYANLFKLEQAMEWLEKAYDEKSYRLIYLDVDPFFENLHADKRLVKMLESMDLKKKKV